MANRFRRTDVLGTLVPALVLAVVINAILAQSTFVWGQSVEPNLDQNQREKVGYHWHGPQRGAIVVLSDPAGGPISLTKRAAGLPGERVTITDGCVCIDGIPLDEPCLTQVTQGRGGSWLVPPLHVFVSGDNRGHGRDVRYFGPVPSETIIGHAVCRDRPPDKFGGLP